MWPLSSWVVMLLHWLQIDEFIRDGKFAALDAPKHGALYAAMAAV